MKKSIYCYYKKINTYLSFIESGEIYKEKPEAKGKIIRIQIAFSFELSGNAMKFIFSVANILHDAGYKLEYQMEKPYKLRCTPRD